MKRQRIGCISVSDEIAETYVRFQIEEREKLEFPDPEDWQHLVKGYMDETYYHRSVQPGSSFCTDIRVMPVPYTDDRFIGIARHEYDI